MPDQTDPREKENRQEARRWYVEGMVTGVLASLLFALFLVMGARLKGKIVPPGGGDSGEQQEVRVLTSYDTAYKLSEMEQLVDTYYLHDVDEDKMAAYLFYGVAAGLDDPYAQYYTKEEYSEFTKENRGEFFGIGCVVAQSGTDGSFTITNVYQDSPAMRAGLLADDRIIALEGESVEGLTLSELVGRIHEFDDSFSMGIYRKSEEKEYTFSIRCEEIQIQTVTTKLLEPGIGYLQLTEFDFISPQQFEDGMKTLEDQGISKLILDLRGNPGGMLTSVCDIADYLLPDGLILYTEDRSGRHTEYRSDDDRSTDLEIAVLVDENSASASEVLAGALQDRGAGVIVGRKTFGKGVVQNTFELSDGSAFKFTISDYYTPSGKNIDGEGITPDYIVEEETAEGTPQPDTDRILDKAVEVLKANGTENDLPGTAGRADETGG